MENQQQVKTKPEISWDEYEKLDIRICEIISVKKVEKTDKLYELKINTGFDERTVISGIAQHFTEEELTGKKMPFILNLKPTKIRGIMSTGMIIMAKGLDEKHFELSNELAEPGSIVI